MTSAILLLFAHQFFILGDSITGEDLYRVLVVFTPIYIAAWILVSYFYKKERKKRSVND